MWLTNGHHFEHRAAAIILLSIYFCVFPLSLPLLFLEPFIQHMMEKKLPLLLT